MTPDSVSLRPENLTAVNPAVAVPGYDRATIAIGMVHLGVGGFHRAHQAWYVDNLMNRGEAMDWGICGVGVLPGDAAMRDALHSQRGLYTLVIKNPDGSLTPRVVGSIVEYLLAPEDPEAVLARMTAPATRIVSMTITEGGYNIDPVTGNFDAGNQDVTDDAHADGPPRTAFGLLTEALQRRRAAGTPPFTVMSCDNIPDNGDVARRMLTAFARLRSPALADWIDEHVSFPNSMVDRITPGTTDMDRHVLARSFGLVDAWPVMCEPFTQWVLEEDFPLGRPPLQDAGVQLVEDVTPYELMKLRLLNASHQAMCYLGYLAGHRYAHEVCSDPTFVAYLQGYMAREAAPTLPPVPGVDLERYQSTLIERFANPEIRDPLVRLCAESSDRIPKWVLPVIRDQLALDGDISHAVLIVAAWARYAEGTDEQGSPIVVTDRLAAQLTAAASNQQSDPLAFVRQRFIFGDLVDDTRFSDGYLAALSSLHTVGARETVARLLQTTS